MNTTFKNHLYANVNERRKEIVLKNFPELSNCIDNLYLSIEKYIQKTPEKFYDRLAFNLYYRFLCENDNDILLISLINDNTKAISRSYSTIQEMSLQTWHDNLNGTDLDLMKVINNEGNVPLNVENG